MEILMGSRSNNVGYGLDNALQTLAPQPIIAKRNPKSSDVSSLGTLWVNTLTDGYFILTTAGNWEPQGTSSSSVASLAITGGAGDVLTVAAGGDTVLGGTLDVAGATVLAGALTVAGAIIANGDFDLSSASAISFISTANASPSILLETNGGTTEDLEIRVTQGTSIDSLLLASASGGIKISSGIANTDAINLIASTGGFTVDAGLTSAINVVGAGQDIQLNATGGSVAITATESVAGAVTISASGASGTILLSGTAGITAASNNSTISVQSGTGALNISADAAATTVSLATGAGVKAVTLGSTNTTSSTTVQSGSGALDITSANGALGINSGTGTISISTDSTAAIVNIATGASDKTARFGSIAGASQTIIQSGTAGVQVTSAGTGDITLASADTVLIDAVGVLELNSSAGVIGIGNDAVAAAINIGTGASDRDITIGNVTASTTIVLNTPVGTNVVAANGLSVTTAGRGLSLPGGLLVISGAGSPNGAISAAQGSLYLRTDGSSTSTRAYSNSDGATAWVAFTTAS